MPNDYLVHADLEQVAASLGRTYQQPDSVVWVSLLDGQDLFASSSEHTPDEVRDKEDRHFAKSVWAVEGYQGKILPGKVKRPWRDAVFAAFLSETPGAISPLDRAIASALALREDCMQWNLKHTWQPRQPPCAGWQYQLQPKTGIAERGDWLTALSLARQARAGEILVEEQVWQALSERVKLLFQPGITGIRFGMSHEDWQKSFEESAKILAAVERNGHHRDQEQRMEEQLGLAGSLVNAR
jgi:hypothetical protein